MHFVCMVANANGVSLDNCIPVDLANYCSVQASYATVAKPGGGPRGPCPPPKLLVVNFPINLRCYVLLGCRVINVILAINIGDSAF